MSTFRSIWQAVLDRPQAVAIRALGFLASDRSELERFLAASGLTHRDLERHPVSPEHLAAILDFLIADETALLKFARAVDLPPEAVYEARRAFKRAAPRAGLLGGRSVVAVML